jgi:hypothetical protein
VNRHADPGQPPATVDSTKRKPTTRHRLRRGRRAR